MHFGGFGRWTSIRETVTTVSRHPPVDRTGSVRSKWHASIVALVVGRDVHDGLAECKESLAGEVLREEVGEIFVSADKGYSELVFFNDFAYIEVAACDVLGAVVVLGVVREIAGSHVVCS